MNLNFDAGVVVLIPSTGSIIVPGKGIYPPEVESAIRGGEIVIPNGTFLRIGPPWPNELRDKAGTLPSYVVREGLKWRASTVQEIQNDRSGTLEAYRARVEILLIVDGEVIDLDRIRLPKFVIDKRNDLPPEQ